MRNTAYIRWAIVILTLFTAYVHGVVLNQRMGYIDPLFTLNALGYLALLVALIAQWPKGRLALVHYAFIAFTAVTILAWVILNLLRGNADTLGYATKAAELLLIIFLYLHLKRPQVQSAL